MKIGIFLPDFRPETGGASSLLRTIKKEILDSNDKENEYLFLYDGKNASLLETISDGFKFLKMIPFLGQLP